MFMGPFDQMIPWDTNGVIGVRRFLDRVWQLYQHQLQGENDSTAADDKQREVESLLHRTVEKVSADIETQDYNTAVSAMMIFINAAFETKNLRYDLAEIFLRLLSPFAPHLAEELWRQMGHRESISEQVWPEADPELARQEQVSLAVQIDGKLRGVVTVPTNATAERVEAVARQLEGVSKHLEGHSIKNVIFVPNRLINFVRN
jgi:leucyl-tRNA synthetase